MAMTMMRRERAQEEDVTGNDEDEGRGGGYDVYKHRPKNGGNAGHGKKNENCTQQHLQTSAA
jgi:hypothetical protein